MPEHLRPDRMYRMPIHFGPRTGPRQGPGGRKFDCIDNPRATAADGELPQRRGTIGALSAALFLHAG